MKEKGRADISLPTFVKMEENKNENSYLIPGAIVLAGVLIAAAVMYSSTATRSPGPANVGDSVPEAVSGDLTDDDPTLGNPEAPVTIVEFSDFQCPFCRKFYLDTLSEIKEKYVKTGKVKFVYRDFPLTSIHDMAQTYAEAGECADDQGKFWGMHDKIFEEQQKRGSGTVTDFTAADIKRWARELGLDGAKFDSCLNSGKYTAEVDKDFADGQRNGVEGTPATFVNGLLVPGAVPFSQFKALIEEELAKVDR